LRRYAGLAGATVGVVAAGVAAGVLAERTTVRRRRAEHDVPFGSLRGTRHTVVADDRLELYAEVDEPDAGAGSATPTVVFVHGYALNLDCWHFQRAWLRGDHRLVLYDQRSHGRSGRSRPEHCTIDQLGRDLASVVEQTCVDRPAILVGHSMGGMAIMALAHQRPEWFGSRITGAALISTSAGGLDHVSFGLPGAPGRALQRLSPAIVATLARAPRLVERGRRAGSDIGFVVTRRLGFGRPVPDEYVDFTDEMLASTPIEVVADFFPDFAVHDKFQALGALERIPTVVLGGSEDAITPVTHTRRIAEALPSAELVELPGVGHMTPLEAADEVDEALAKLLQRATDGEEAR
jgi:pimeloyl-ACP methyl ester carboxylesterase